MLYWLSADNTRTDVEYIICPRVLACQMRIFGYSILKPWFAHAYETNDIVAVNGCISLLR